MVVASSARKSKRGGAFYFLALVVIESRGCGQRQRRCSAKRRSWAYTRHLLGAASRCVGGVAPRADDLGPAAVRQCGPPAAVRHGPAREAARRGRGRGAAASTWRRTHCARKTHRKNVARVARTTRSQNASKKREAARRTHFWRSQNASTFARRVVRQKLLRVARTSALAKRVKKTRRVARTLALTNASKKLLRRGPARGAARRGRGRAKRVKKLCAPSHLALAKRVAGASQRGRRRGPALRVASLALHAVPAGLREAASWAWRWRRAPTTWPGRRPADCLERLLQADAKTSATTKYS